MRSALFVMVVASALAGCSASRGAADAGIDATSCGSTSPYCTIVRGMCCDDVFWRASCVDASWECDVCVIGESSCTTRPQTGWMSECTRQARDAMGMGMTIEEYCGITSP